MSKRFGRQQKRKMREAIASAERGKELLKKRVDFVLSERAELRRTVDDVANILGAHFIGLEPETREIEHLQFLARGCYEVGVRSNVSAVNYNATAIQMSTMEFARWVLPILSGSSMQDELRNRDHYRFVYDGKQVGYAIERCEIDRMPLEVLQRRIATEMSNMLVGQLRNAESVRA